MIGCLDVAPTDAALLDCLGAGSRPAAFTVAAAADCDLVMGMPGGGGGGGLSVDNELGVIPVFSGSAILSLISLSCFDVLS